VLIITLAWSVLAFGSPYAWAYTPMLVAASVLGAVGITIGRQPIYWPVALGLCAILATVSLQLVDLAPAILSQVSPATMPIQMKLNLAATTGAIEKFPISIDARRTQLAMVFLFALGLLMVGSSRILDRRSTRILAGGVVTLGVVVALMSMIQRATFNGKIYGFWELRQGGEPFGPFVNRNHFAGWMLMALSVSIGMFAAAFSKHARDSKGVRNGLLWLASSQANQVLLLGFAVMTMALDLVLTLSRSGILGLAGLMTIVPLLIARRQVTAARRRIVLIGLPLVALLAFFWGGLDAINARFAAAGGAGLSDRPEIWRDALRVARDFWLTGTGLNTYGITMLYYQTAMPGLHVREAHNEYLQLAAEGGLLIGIPILVTIAMFVRRVRECLHHDIGTGQWIRVGALAGIAALAIQSFVDFSLQLPGNAVLFTVLCGIALSGCYNDSASTVSISPSRERGLVA
jgi:O-antigen ligase